MRMWLYPVSLALLLAARSGPALVQQSVTLYAPRDKEAKKYDEGRSWFSFERGVRGSADPQAAGDIWDLGYGFLAIGGEDWLMVSHRGEDRSVIKDLGWLGWSDSYSVPILTPLPAPEKGKRRNITVDASARTGKEWEKTNGIFAKAVVGHMYAVRVKREGTDYYALFRVEGLEQGYSCTISWMLVPPPVQ